VVRVRRAPARRALGVFLVTCFAGTNALVALPARAATRDGALLVVEAATGKDIWTRPSRHGLVQLGGMGATLLVASDTMCSEGSSTGPLIGLDAATGRVRWTNPATSVATRSMAWMPSASSDVAADGVVVTGGGRLGPGVTGLDARTGKQVWALGPTLKELGVSDHLVFSAQPSEGGSSVLSAHDRRTGKLRWTFPTTTQIDQWTDTFDVVAADRTTVVVGNGGYLGRSGDGPREPTTFFVLDAKDGKPRGSFAASDPSFLFSDMLLADGALVYAERSSVVARDLPDGATRWSHPFDDAVSFSGVSGVAVMSTRGTQRVLVQVNGPGRVAALDLADGSERWTIPKASVRASDTRHTVLLRPDSSSVLTGVDTRSGKRQWRRSVPRSVISGKYDTVTTGVASGRTGIAKACDTG
jgi:outer membrane protein assembly factor BamB